MRMPNVEFSSIATRYDNLADNFLALVKPAAIWLWLRANSPRPSLLFDAALRGCGLAPLVESLIEPPTPTATESR